MAKEVDVVVRASGHTGAHSDSYRPLRVEVKVSGVFSGGGRGTNKLLTRGGKSSRELVECQCEGRNGAGSFFPSSKEICRW